MGVLGTTTKVALGGKAAKSPLGRGAAAKTLKAAPGAAKSGLKLGKPVLKRRTRKRVDEATDAVVLALAGYAPRAVRRLGLEPPKRKRTTPRVLAGAAMGAAAMYLFEPGHGAEHRKQLAKLLG
jgi:hypothetical protein